MKNKPIIAIHPSFYKWMTETQEDKSAHESMYLFTIEVMSQLPFKERLSLCKEILMGTEYTLGAPMAEYVEIDENDMIH